MTTSTDLAPIVGSIDLSFPNALGSLDQYIQAINRFPLLTQEEENELARRWKHYQDLEAARKLVLSHLRFVVAISKQYLGYGLPQADLIQEGNIGLMRAVRRFDVSRGVRLASFALHWIKAEIHEFIIRNWRLVKVATTKAQRKLFFNLRSLKSSDYLSSHRCEEIAQDLGVKPEDVREMDLRLTGGDIAFEAPVDAEETYAPIDYLEAPNSNPMTLIEKAQSEAYEHHDLEEALSQLDDRSRDIIQARWLKEDGGETLQELAARYAVSAERIRQLELQAMKKLRHWMGASTLAT